MDEPRTDEGWREPSRALPELSAIRLEALLHELLERVGAVTAMQARLRALLDAVVGIASDLELPRMLERIVTAAAELTGAQYGALGVLDSDRRLSEFITYGISAEQRALLGSPPEGHGVLGLLIESPEPLRMPDISAHAQSYGFPANHPVMKSLVGVRVRIRDRVFGNLYLAEKQGAKEFSKDDEDVLSALAAAAGVAIENAALYEMVSRRQRWLEAGTEISNLLLGDVRRDDALQLVAARAREISGSYIAFIALLDDETSELVVTVADGELSGPLLGRRLPLDDTLNGSVLRSGAPIVVDHVDPDGGPESGALWSQLPVRPGPTMIVPLRSGTGASAGTAVPAGAGIPGAEGDVGAQGTLTLIARAERHGFTAQDVQLAESFAAQAALALASAQAQADRELLAVLRDRDRIARDLHDVVIQRLFATGLSLQATARLASPPQVHTRVDAAVDDLDAVIRDIRGAIFELHHRAEESDLRATLRALIDEAEHVLGFAPRLHVRGPLPTVPDEIRPHLLAVVREALSNTARHAAASTVDVEVSVASDAVSLTVTDNGSGIGTSTRRSGLENLRRRAEEMGGSFAVMPAEAYGTVLIWRVPAS